LAVTSVILPQVTFSFNLAFGEGVRVLGRIRRGLS